MNKLWILCGTNLPCRDLMLKEEVDQLMACSWVAGLVSMIIHCMTSFLVMWIVIYKELSIASWRAGSMSHIFFKRLCGRWKYESFLCCALKFRILLRALKVLLNFGSSSSDHSAKRAVGRLRFFVLWLCWSKNKDPQLHSIGLNKELVNRARLSHVYTVTKGRAMEGNDSCFVGYIGTNTGINVVLDAKRVTNRTKSKTHYCLVDEI